MDIQFLGGAREVGRSAVLVNDALLLDFGMKNDTPTQFPAGSSHGSGLDPEAVVVSHGHLDHVGAIPALLSGSNRPTIHWTPPTRDLALLLARDTLKLRGGTVECPFTREDLNRVGEVSVTHDYGEPFEAAGHEVTFYDAGHIPGSAHVLVDDSEVPRTAGQSSGPSPRDSDTRLLYTGDFHTDDQRIVPGTTARPDADVVLCESTYSDVEHEPRAEVERRFVERVRSTIWEGGTVVVPAFAIGRTQEVMLVCAEHDIDCYVDGMGTQVSDILRQYPEFLRDADAFQRAVSNARAVTGRDGQRRRIARNNNVVITTAGMLSGGPAMTYVPEIADRPVNTIAFTGYQVEGTPGRDLLETGSAEIDGRRMPVSAGVEAYDFSAHADREGLLDFLDEYRGAEILVNHGDRCEAFAAELDERGYDASAPEIGDTYRYSTRDSWTC